MPYCTVTVLTLLLFEAAARLYMRDALVEAPMYEARADPPGYRLMANFRGSEWRSGEIVRMTTAADGLRTTPGSDASSEVPVHIVGGSDVFGWHMADEATLGAKLQVQLAGRYRVLNHGVPGHGPFEYQRVLEQIDEADWTVLVFTEQTDLYAAYFPRWLPAVRCGYVLRTDLWLAQYLPCWLRSSRAMQLGSNFLLRRFSGQLPTPMNFEPSDEVAARVLMARIARSVAEERARRGNKLIVTFVPWSAPYRRPAASTAAQLHRVMAFPDDCGIEAAFASTANPAALFIADGEHLSPAGTERLAEAIATRLP